jgi:hypothetical protein
VDAVVGEEIRIGDVQPVRPAFHAETTLVKVDDIRGNELLPRGIQAGLNLSHHLSISIQYQGFCRGMPVEVSQQLTRDCQWDELVVVQIGGVGFDARTILDRFSNRRREVRLYPLSALGTHLDFGLVH